MSSRHPVIPKGKEKDATISLVDDTVAGSGGGGSVGLEQPLTLRQSLRQQMAKQKYARYTKDRYTSSHPFEEPQAEISYWDRGRAKVGSYLKRKRVQPRGKEKEDRVVDILYENQRGWFLFGFPRYSSASLLPCDPAQWQHGDFCPSPVDIRNAQVPDPSWEWEWSSWYVDMGRDVDEEGWEYCTAFRQGFKWHGNHPWMSSFVRRRRWLRARVRRRAGESSTSLEALNDSGYSSIQPSSGGGKSRAWEPIEEEIANMPSLILALRNARVDREKLVAVRQFVEHGEDELYYLAECMNDIMSLFIFQNSRRQLLTELMEAHYDPSQAENMKRAIDAAAAQVENLEYWSDVKSVPHTPGHNSPTGKGNEDVFSLQSPGLERYTTPIGSPLHAGSPLQ